MKKLFLSMLSLFIIAISFSGCVSKEQKVSEPYYDRANKAAKDAHERLNKD